MKADTGQAREGGMNQQSKEAKCETKKSRAATLDAEMLL
jgi:hypothetical protein